MRINGKHYSYEYETSIEVLRGEDDDAEYVEVEVTLNFDVSSPEPDVGLFGYGVDDYEFSLPDGKPLPDDVRAAIDGNQAWQDRQCEKAVEDFDPMDYVEDREPDYDD
jgi:hypothetical protein